MIIELAVDILRSCWTLLGAMAPYLLFGFLAAGFLSVAFSPAWIERHLGRRRFGTVLKAALLGVPLPLCSCGVIPVAASIRRHGASRGATLSFLLSTPQTGVDSIAVTWALLGPILAVYRPIAALATGLFGGAFEQVVGRKDNADAEAPTEQHHCTDACCADPGRRSLVVRALRYGFVSLPRDIGPALLAGVLIAGVITALAPLGAWHDYLGEGFWSIVLAMALGVPIYVCATASVPIAAGLIHLGASPGTALAFLIAGPATNAATISTIYKVLGARAAVVFLLTIALSAVGSGLLLDQWRPAVEASLPESVHQAGHAHLETVDWPGSLWAVGLLAVIAVSYCRTPKLTAANLGLEEEEPPTPAGTAAPRSRIELEITGMTCSHCVEAVARALRECPGVRQVEVTLRPGRAVVSGADLDAGKLAAAVRALGYEASEAQAVREDS
ncbi:MAG: SO_0444 family Cu/Zn efflux transporter [Pirellulales bacterium]|nr:SO_0444 family Cu/Zn efflux transporter [Pirellulales bacterium]